MISVRALIQQVIAQLESYTAVNSKCVKRTYVKIVLEYFFWWKNKKGCEKWKILSKEGALMRASSAK